MEVNINNLVSNIRTIDSDSLLTPRVLEKILKTVLEAIREKEDHRKRMDAEHKINSIVPEELQENWG